MAKRQSYYQNLKWVVRVLLIAAVGFCVLISVQAKYGMDFGLPEDIIPTEGFIGELFNDNFTGIVQGPDYELQKDFPEARLKVHFIDVGQAKAILIEAPEKTVLIDAGENDAGGRIVRYIVARGISKLDIVIGTHPHSDHIGGLDTVILGIPVESVVLPEIPEELTPTTPTYTGLLEAIAAKKLRIHVPVCGESFDLGDGAELTVLGPVNDYADLNDYSVVTKLSYGETSFLFTGDATSTSERDMLVSGGGLHATVLDVGHHGSNTSTSGKFLEAVSPQLAVISCGMDNSYGHPHREVMERLGERSVQVLRTDLDGTAVIYSDGKILKYITEK